MTTNIKVESGLSFLSRLTSRPSIDTCLGPGLGPLSQFYTRVLVTGDTCVDSVSIINRYITEVICRTIAQLGDDLDHCQDVDGAGVVLLDCCHHVSVENIAAELQRKCPFDINIIITKFASIVLHAHPIQCLYFGSHRNNIRGCVK